jgi:hypothetical protein
MMGFDSVECGGHVSAVLLRNGDFIACVYRGLVEDYARRAVSNLAQKVFRSARKKFSRLIIKVYEREVSAWDYYCYGLYKGNSAFRDKFVSDFIRVGLMKRIDALPEEKCRLIEISACNLHDIDEHTVLDRETVFALVLAEVQVLALNYGRSMPQISLGGTTTAHHAIENGASPL